MTELCLLWYFLLDVFNNHWGWRKRRRLDFKRAFENLLSPMLQWILVSPFGELRLVDQFRRALTHPQNRPNLLKSCGQNLVEGLNAH